MVGVTVYMGSNVVLCLRAAQSHEASGVPIAGERDPATNTWHTHFTTRRMRSERRMWQFR